MARNIEIKAQATNFSKQFQLATELADGAATTLIQTDTFFKTPVGRLKLREFPNRNAQLIYYHRDNLSGPKLSNYHISNTPNAGELKLTLAETMGVLAVVKKNRTLLMRGRTRLHFDKVQGLGDFIELEVVLDEHDAIDLGQQEAEDLMQALEIRPSDLIKPAYVDLLLAL